ncbi:MAG TPA: matrixin family metalloprotease [Polyangiaceae bacterium]|nr:matrixin family metalloprotease [Polyangiaceae bacterium]
MRRQPLPRLPRQRGGLRLTRSGRAARARGRAPVALLAACLAAGLARPAGAYCRSVACPADAFKRRGADGKLVGCFNEDTGCPDNYPKAFWRSSCVGFSFQRDFSDIYERDALREAIRRSFQTWSQAPCPGGGFASVSFVELARVSCDRVEFNLDGPNANAVIFRDEGFEYESSTCNSPDRICNTLARTITTYDLKTGEIMGADVEINSSYNVFGFDGEPEAFDLEAVITHEVGHFLGIAHTQAEEHPDATMFASIAPGQTAQRYLTNDDLQALCEIYPPGPARERCDPEPWGGFASACGDAPSGCSAGPPGRARGGAALLALGLLAAARAARPSRARPRGGGAGRGARRGAGA